MTMIEPRNPAVEPLVERTAVERAANDKAIGFDAVSGPQRSMRGGRLGGFLLLAGVSMLVFAQVGYILSQVLDDVWQARVEVEYRGNSWTETEDIAVRSRSLTGPIAAEYGIDIKDFEEDLKAGLVGGTQILRIEYFDTDAELAQNVVTDLAAAYVLEASERPPESARTILEAQLAELQTELNDSQDRLAAEAPEAGIALTASQQDLQAEIASLRARVGVLELRLLDSELEAETVEARGLPRYITRPFVFQEPSFPQPMRMVLVGALIGLFLGLIPLVMSMYRSQVR